MRTIQGNPTHFIDGEPIPEGYLEQMHVLVNEICDIEEEFPEWELEQYAREHSK